MTREEIKKGLISYLDSIKWGIGEYHEVFESLINMLSLPEKDEWIPITKETELPEHDVICCNNEGDIALGYLYFDEEENQIACDRDPYVMLGVVAYMELPEPYKAEKGES